MIIFDFKIETMRVGNTIKEIREKERNIRQEYVAKKLGIGIRAYKNIEANNTDITLDRLEEIAKILDVTVVQLISNKTLLGGIQNNFNNGQGNQGTNIMHQGMSVELIQQLYERLIQEKDAIIASLESKMKQ